MKILSLLCLTEFLIQCGIGIAAAGPTDSIHSSQANPPDFHVNNLQFHSPDGVELFGRLVLPKLNAPRAVVIYVQTAEGATVDMKRPLGGGKTFNYYDLYREKLTGMGLGFFSYEGRGIRMGEEPPRYEQIDPALYNTSTLQNKVRDLLSAIETVRSQDGLSDVPILLMGASEGTLLAAEAAAEKPEAVAGLVLYGVLATNLRETFRYIMSGGEFLRYRTLDRDRDGTITETEWKEQVKGVDFSKADLNTDGAFTVDDIKVATKKYLDAIDRNDYDVLQDWAKTSAAVSVPKGWFKDHFEHPDNWTFLSQLKIPIGLFQGDADRMTPISAVKELEEKAGKANRQNMEFHFFEGLDHSLNVVQYFINGELPKGHAAMFEYMDRIVPRIQ